MTRGTYFQGGNPLEFYGQIRMSASAFTYFDNSPGKATAFIDPTIRLNSALRSISGLQLFAGDRALALAFVPEPASWALMLGGFGLVGGYARTRRSPKLA